jgi:ribosome-associated heat shock protein Hsp15
MSDASNADERRRVRIDKWLWAARFFKTRSQAAAAVAGGRVLVGGVRAKASRPVAIGDEVEITKGAVVWTVVVRRMSEQRRGAPEAALLYEETEASRARRAEEAASRRQPESEWGLRSGRPSKRERRLTDWLRRRS